MKKSIAEPSRFSLSVKPFEGFFHWGTFWLLLAVIGAGAYFNEGIAELLKAWQLPEYSHGPLIPVLSGLLFLRQLKTVPVNAGEVTDRGPGVFLLILAVLLGAAGKLIEIRDIVAYALILWVGALLLISFGWRTGKHFWPPVVHLIYMLPLPGALYYGVSTYLQGVSSEIGVYLLQLLRVPVFLEGNIIDLGVYKLQVAEACSGLRYLFPILSFSYIFAVLYRGPTWHKAILLVSAVPITVFMNSVRIAVAGIIVNHFGLSHLEGFSHFFEGWVIFIICVLILFALAWVLVKLRRDRVGLIEALDLDTDGLGTQAKRIGLVRPSAALITAAVLVISLASAWAMIPKRQAVVIERDPFLLFPTRIGDWRTGPHKPLDVEIERVLGADDYMSVTLTKPGQGAPVELFTAWYKNQDRGGVHSPEVCLPGAGWEIAKLEQIDVTPRSETGRPFTINRAIIQKGVTRMMVYYWYEQQGVRTASMFDAKLNLMLSKFMKGRNDSAIIRLTTQMGLKETDENAERRLSEVMYSLFGPLQGFVPD
ncbi:Transmembrane exosortase (Exosortase_EpsH) [Roseovarius litorisediminis]|uniref:Transmembrane exosortase (Exosortase_EpsH) n=1 Tax=Roseovarius litorisediminis TaxID=1312363 RepID=A0A1Y5SWP3_9RHOB|nr:VPLPA-CTERM-specific exosortase XrtD [Roseovarius litorisediminis]SLN46806.1 Transmembrane exosortase (Exosortase_EpsH) [Roseovarius litorisediminis]